MNDSQLIWEAYLAEEIPGAQDKRAAAAAAAGEGASAEPYWSASASPKVNPDGTPQYAPGVDPGLLARAEERGKAQAEKEGRKHTPISQMSQLGQETMAKTQAEIEKYSVPAANMRAATDKKVAAADQYVAGQLQQGDELIDYVGAFKRAVALVQQGKPVPKFDGVTGVPFKEKELKMLQDLYNNVQGQQPLAVPPAAPPAA